LGAPIAKPRDSTEPPQKPHAAVRPAREPMGSHLHQLPAIEGIFDSGYWAAVRRELVQNRPGVDGLFVSANADTNGASVSDVLRDIAESLRPLSQATGREIQLEVFEHGTVGALDSNLRTAIRALLESSMAQGSGRVRVVSRLDEPACGQRFILIEVLDDALDVPDAVRRKLSKAVMAHAGQTSYIAARTGSCVRIKIPKAETPQKSANWLVSGEYQKTSSCEPATSSDYLGSELRSRSELSEYIPRF